MQKAAAFETKTAATIDWNETRKTAQTLPRIDLHARRRQERQSLRRAAGRDGALLACAVLLIAALAVPLTVSASQAASRAGEARRAQADAVKQTRRLTSEQQTLDAQIAAAQARQQTRQARQLWARALRTLARSAPPGIVFERVQLDAAAPQKASVLEIAVSGHADSVMHVTQFAAALSRAPHLAAVHLTQTDADPSALQNGVRFALTANAQN